MKKKVFSKVVASIAAISICFSCISATAAGQKASIALVQANASVSPYFIAIVSYFNNLTLNSGGRLTCEGETEVQYGYIAGITIELQQYNKQWTTIKTWSDSDSTIVSLSKDWYVASGYQYRLKLTHTAMESDLTVVETFISYSKTVTYN